MPLVELAERLLVSRRQPPQQILVPNLCLPRHHLFDVSAALLYIHSVPPASKFQEFTCVAQNRAVRESAAFVFPAADRRFASSNTFSLTRVLCMMEYSGNEGGRHAHSSARSRRCFATHRGCRTPQRHGLSLPASLAPFFPLGPYLDRRLHRHLRASPLVPALGRSCRIGLR